MKPILLFLICLPIFISAQQVEKTYPNEIGIEVTGLWKQILGTQVFSQNDYFITYRRYFNGFNINTGLGFNYSNELLEIISEPTVNNTRLKINRSLNYRLGFEKMKTLRPKLQAFYGIFYTQSFQYSYDDRYRTSGGFAIGQIQNLQQSGLAPFLGIRYNFTDRIGIETSSMLNFYYEQDQRDQFRRYIGPISGTVPSEFSQKSATFAVSNQLPIFIIFTIRI